MTDAPVPPSESTLANKSRAFGRDARLHNSVQLQTVKNSLDYVSGRLCLIKVLKEPPDGQRRAAFLLSRRFDHSAVVRNRARRLLREVFRLLFPELPPVWMLFIPRQAIKEAKMQDVLSEARRACQRLKLL